MLSLVLGFSIQAQNQPSGYELIWQDEFEGKLLDETKWELRYPGPRRDAINSAHCISVQKGFLALRTELKNDSIFTAMIGSQYKFETAFGYFEIRCLLPQDEGHWAAFWLQTPAMGKFIGQPDKAGAEIDIFEFLPNRPTQIHHTLHYDGYGKDHKVKHKLIKNRKFNSAQWHTFGFEWTPTHYNYFIDGKKTFTVKKGVSHREQYLILSLEVGDWAGNIGKASLPDYFIVDYVRVYKQKSHLIK